MATSSLTFVVLSLLSTCLTLAAADGKDSINDHGILWSRAAPGGSRSIFSNIADGPAQIWHQAAMGLFGDGLAYDPYYPYPYPYPYPQVVPPYVYAPPPAPAPPSVIMIPGRQAANPKNHRRMAKVAPGGRSLFGPSNFIDWPAQLWHSIFGNGMPLDGYPYPPPVAPSYVYAPPPAPAPAPPSVIMVQGRAAAQSNDGQRTAKAAPEGRSPKGRSFFGTAVGAPIQVAKEAMDTVFRGFGGFAVQPPFSPSYVVAPPPAQAPPPQVMVIRGREAPKEDDEAPQGASARLYGTSSSRTCLFAFCMDLAEVHRYTAQKQEQCFCQPQRCECNPESAIAPMKVYDGEPQDHSEPLELLMSCNVAMPCIPTPPCPRAKSCRNNGDGYTKCVCYAPGACSCWQEDDDDAGDRQPRIGKDNIQIEKRIAPEEEARLHSAEELQLQD